MGGGNSEYWGEGGGNFSLALTDRSPCSPNQCQIMTFLKLKTDNIAKFRMVFKSILLETLSNKIKSTYIKLILL